MHISDEKIVLFIKFVVSLDIFKILLTRTFDKILFIDIF